MLEAMATGLAVVTTNAGDHGSIIENGVSGALVATNSADAIAEACGRLIADPALRANLGRQARDVAESFNIAASAAAYERFYLAELGFAELPMPNCQWPIPAT
jgi:glycosyltransferase involved in cell wall biosynthesis